MDNHLVRGLAALAATLPLMSYAGPMDYSHAEIGFIQSEIDDGPLEVSGSGFGLRGSVGFLSYFFAFAEYQNVDFDDVDASLLLLGGGVHWSITDWLDIVGRLGMVRDEVEFSGLFGQDSSINEEGVLYGARLRAELTPRLEVEGGLDHRKLDLLGDQTEIVLDGRYFFTENLAVGLMFETSDDAKSQNYSANVRVTF